MIMINDYDDENFDYGNTFNRSVNCITKKEQEFIEVR